ncbi:hypothetical protein VF03_30100 [Nostoc linckia z2]|nr:hypothetical protein VF03_30100 [Nostoc linckia z2]
MNGGYCLLLVCVRKSNVKNILGSVWCYHGVTLSLCNKQKDMKKTKKHYCVFLQFEAFEFNIEATSKAEAKQKALKKLQRKQLKSLLDKNNTSVDTY